MLDGASVIYGGALDLQATLDYDFRIEKEFDYSNLSMSEIITIWHDSFQNFGKFIFLEREIPEPTQFFL